MSVIQEAHDFDPAAFIAAAQALASQPLKAVSLPGLPPCFKRVLTAGDVIDAAACRDKLVAAGLPVDAKVNVAIGLAQALCGPAGQPIFDAGNRAHIELLAALPWEAVRSVAGAEDAGPNA
jgi:hypothetical protein